MNNTSAKVKYWREGRRLRAWELKSAGWSQREIADALGVTEGAVSQWMKRAREGGVQALLNKPRPGRPRKLDRKGLHALEVLLREGAEALGFRGNVWTSHRIAAVISSELGISYHPNHVFRIMRAIGWSCQKPVRRARQRDEGRIEHWRKQRWPELKKGQNQNRRPSSA